MKDTSAIDPHAQLRALYQSLLQNQHHFDEFKQLLAMYTPPASADLDVEPPDAASVRAHLNERIREWLGTPFEGLCSAQVVQWRAIVVEERINVAISPWKEANAY